MVVGSGGTNGVTICAVFIARGVGQGGGINTEPMPAANYMREWFLNKWKPGRIGESLPEMLEKEEFHGNETNIKEDAVLDPGTLYAPEHVPHQCVGG